MPFRARRGSGALQFGCAVLGSYAASSRERCRTAESDARSRPRAAVDDFQELLRASRGIARTQFSLRRRSLTVRSAPGLLAELALKQRLPTIFGSRDNIAAGGLMSYAPDHHDLIRRAAIYIDKILRGAKPSEIPVEQASTYQLVINLRTAKALGLTIPPTLLARADEVIE